MKQEQRKPAAVPAPTEEVVDWGDIFKRLVAYGVKGLRLQLEDAKQVAQEALRRHFDPEYAAWDRTKYETRLQFLGSVMNGIASDIRQRKGHANERLTNDGDLPMRPARAASPEARVSDGEQVRVAVTKLLARTEGAELEQKIVFLMLDGVDTAAEQAAALGVSVRDVYKARERLKAHRDAVMAEMDEN